MCIFVEHVSCPKWIAHIAAVIHVASKESSSPKMCRSMRDKEGDSHVPRVMEQSCRFALEQWYAARDGDTLQLIPITHKTIAGRVSWTSVMIHDGVASEE